MILTIPNQLDHTNLDLIWVYLSMVENLHLYLQRKIILMIGQIQTTNKKKDSHQILAAQIYHEYQ